MGDKVNVTYYRYELASAYFRVQKYKEAIKYFREGFELSQSIGDRIAIVRNLSSMGQAYYESGDFKSAVDAYEKCIPTQLQLESDAANKSQLDPDLFELEMALGDAYQRVGNSSKALEAFEAAYSKSKTLQNLPDQYQALFAIADEYDRQRKYASAIDYGNQALRLYLNGDKGRSAFAYDRLAVFLSHAKKRDEARNAFKQSLKLANAFLMPGHFFSRVCQLRPDIKITRLIRSK